MVRPSTDSGPDHRGRRSRFAAALAASDFVAAIVSQPRDLFYLTGTAQPCNLLVEPGAEPVLFARRFADLARFQTDIEDVRDGAGLSHLAAELAGRGIGRGKLGLELDVIPAALYRSALRAFPGFELEDCSPPLLELRAVKDEHELGLLRHAASMFGPVHEALVSAIAPGRSELDLAAEVQRALRALGHTGLVHHRRWDGDLPPEGSIASGENLTLMSGGPITVSGVGLGPAFPIGASRRILQPSDVVNIDLGLNFDGYHADMARTYVLASPSDELLAAARAVREIQDRVLAALRPGPSSAEIYETARAAAEELGVEDVFQGHGGTHGPYIGHSIGLELDEPPVLGPGRPTEILAGMVLAIEPKLISPRFGAVNLEDDVVVTADGCELLSEMTRSVFLVDAGRVEPLAPVSS